MFQVVKVVNGVDIVELSTPNVAEAIDKMERENDAELRVGYSPC